MIGVHREYILELEWPLDFIVGLVYDCEPIVAQFIKK